MLTDDGTRVQEIMGVFVYQQGQLNLHVAAPLARWAGVLYRDGDFRLDRGLW